jgi:D-3-phosphoglycerate dehydrogenase / 2-oxoglutarate reductase
MRCLIIDDMHSGIVSMLQELGVAPEYRPGINRSEILESVSAYEMLMVRSKTPIDRELVAAATNLKLVARAGAGLDNLDMEVLNARGIEVINASEGNRDAVAEHAVGLLLSLTNKIQKADKEVRSLIWDREGNRGVEVMGRTVGIVGYGFMGQAFASRLQGFGCKVLAYDKYKEGFGDHLVKEATMQEVFQEADVLSLHVPLTSETRGLVDKYYLNRFNKQIFLINTSRGEVVHLHAVTEALVEGKVLGAGLDVLENEKLHLLTPEQRISFESLVNSDRVVLTPHVAGWSVESYKKINEVLVEKIRGFLSTIS